MITIGLTGSIGMGKSTAAKMFEDMGVPVHDSDAAVHDLMRPGGQGYRAIAKIFPYYEYPQIYDRKTKEIDRKELGKIVFSDDAEREKLEGVLHPLVRAAQKEFIARQKRLGRKIVLLDIPLLFETGAEESCDYTVCVSAPAHIQRQRVMARPGMTEEKFAKILQRQMPDGEKRARADYVIHSGLGMGQTYKDVGTVLYKIKEKAGLSYRPVNPIKKLEL